MKINNRSFCLITFLLSLVLPLIIVLSLNFGAQTPPRAKDNLTVADLSGNSIAASRISYLTALNTLPFVNYTPNQFVKPGANPGIADNERKVELSSNPREDKKGTYRFVILNLDPADENFDDSAEKMKPFLKGDNYYHFTLYLPAVWSSCNVYVGNSLLSSSGEIADYNFIDYSNYIGETKFHKSATEPLFIDLKFYSKRDNLPPSKPIIAAQIVTIHFETTSGAFGGLSGIPLIGTDEKVRGAANNDKTFLTAVSVFAALILAILVFLSFLKRTLSYFPQQLFVLGVLGALFSSVMLLSAASAPFFLAAAKNFFFSLIPLAAILSMRVKLKKFPLWIPFAAFGAAVCIISAVCPFISASLSALNILNAVLFCAEGAMIISLCLISCAKNEIKATALIAPAIAVIIAVSSVFLPVSLFTLLSPLFWLLFALLAVSVVLSFYTFFELERKNRYLTSNLQNEVSRQTNELQACLTERDKLLSRVSHDLKKPIRSIRQFLTTLKARESDGEQIKTLGIVSQKTDELLTEFEELGNYAKLNFAAEQSKEFNVKTVLEKTFDSFNPDCIANGIIFSLYSPDIMVYGKPKCLVSVINNLVINAIEHASCSQICISAFKKKGVCCISVTDNGKGIEEGKNVFEPYYSESNSEDNIGLGLYICKSLITSMGGDLNYSQASKELTFSVTLPLA